MKYFEVFWRNREEVYNYSKTFSPSEESYMNNFIRDLQERISVEYLEKITHEGFKV